MNARIRSVRRVDDVAVLDRIDVDVIHMLHPISLVTDPVFPIAPLPDAAFPPGLAACADRLGSRQAAREARFSQ